jgi:predicted nucleic acid-binding protein
LTRQSHTKIWWDGGCSGFELFTSQETINEASRGDGEIASKRLELLNQAAVLEITPRVEELTKRLLSAGLVPANVASDAIHIATASVHGIDFLVTWNFKHIANPHIANPHIQAALREEVASFGERLPVLCTPEELLRDEDN